MLKVKNGDLDKLGLLFERYHRALYGFIFHMTGQRELSEDMVQNVFYRMLKYRNSFAGKGEFVVWMFHIGRNILKDHAKQQQRTGKHNELDSIAEQIGGGVLADEQLKKKQDQLLLHTALAKLSTDDREVLTLNKFQELKYHEIAQILNITEGAVKVRVHRAMSQLKEIYINVER